MKEIYRIAIDGPSGAGKSTIAKAVAARLGIDYIDTGAMYRAVGYKVKAKGIDADDEAALASLLNETDIDFRKGDIILDGEVINDKIRTPEISKMASIVSAKGPVRAKLVDIQRARGTRKSIIMDGRDIGTHVLPNADVKIFLTADAHVRALRRYEEFTAKGINCTLENVEREVIERDERDMNRAIAPLKQAEDAVRVDTSQMNIDEVVNCLRQLILDRI